MNLRTFNKLSLVAALSGAIAIPANAASVLIRTPETNGQFVNQASLRFNTGPAEIKIDTNTPGAAPTICDLSIGSTATGGPRIRQTISTPNGPIVRLYDPLTKDVQNVITLSNCRLFSGQPTNDLSTGTLQVYSQ